MVAGVTPLVGLTLNPGVLLEIEKAVFPPPGFTIVRVWVETERSQKLPRKTISCWVATTWGAFDSEPTGRTITPLSDTPYNVFPSLDSTLLPPKFSGRLRLLRTLKLSASRICST